MEDTKQQGSSHSLLAQTGEDQLHSYTSVGGPENQSFDVKCESTETIWLKQASSDGQSEKCKMAEQVVGTVYVLQPVNREPCDPLQSPSFKEEHRMQVAVSSQQPMDNYMSSLEQARLHQLQLELNNHQFQDQQQNVDGLQITKHLVDQIQSWANDGQKADQHSVNITQHSGQTSGSDLVQYNRGFQQAAVPEAVQGTISTGAELGESVSASGIVNSTSEMSRTAAEVVDSKQEIFVQGMTANNYMFKAVDEQYPDKLIDVHREEAQNPQICGDTDENMVDDVTPQAGNTLEAPRQELEDSPHQQSPSDTSRRCEERQECHAMKKDESIQDKPCLHDKTKIHCLLTEALVEFCHNNLYFAEFVHINGRLSLNLDNRETIHLVVSQMAKPQAFSDHIPETPSVYTSKKSFAKRAKNMPLKSGKTQKRGRRRKTASQSATTRKQLPDGRAAGGRDVVHGRKAAARAKEKLARIVPGSSEADDASTTGLDDTDGDLTGDEDYIPNTLLKAKQVDKSTLSSRSSDGSGERISDNIAIARDVKKEEPEDMEGVGTGGRSSMKVEHLSDSGDDARILASATLQCEHCQKVFGSKEGLERHVKAHTLFICSEAGCEGIRCYTRRSIRRHFRDVHDKHVKDLHRCTECHLEFLTEEQLKLHKHDSCYHICSVCGENFADRSSLKQHKNTCHFGKMCHVCGKHFLSKGAFNRHLKRHKEKASGKVKCSECDKEFTAHSSLFHHKKAVHSDIRPYKCTECGLTFNFNNSLKLHRLKHSGLRPYKCDICNKSYLTASHLKNHVQALHSITKQYVCPICDKQFPYDNSLKLHMKLHTGDRPFMCAFCSKTFVSKSALKVHEASHVESKNYKCDICEKSYKTEALMRVHRRRHTPDGSRYMCDICGNTYMYKSNLEVHYEVHGDVKKHKCKVCGKMFKTYPTLYSHYLVHSDKNPFSCSECGKSFKTKERLKAHSVRHSGLKPFSCNQCTSSFPDKGGLSKHKKTVHATVARYACPVCSKLCNRADNLRVHMKVHGDPSLLKLSLEDLAAATKFAQDGEKAKTDVTPGGSCTAKSVMEIQSKQSISPKLDSTGNQNLHVLEAAQPVSVPIPAQHPNTYVHSADVTLAQQLTAVNNPQDVTSQVNAAPFIGMHHWATDGTIHYQNLLLSQGYPTAGMVQTQVHGLDNPNTVVYQTTTQQNADHATQY